MPEEKTKPAKKSAEQIVNERLQELRRAYVSELNVGIKFEISLRIEEVATLYRRLFTEDK